MDQSGLHMPMPQQLVNNIDSDRASSLVPDKVRRSINGIDMDRMKNLHVLRRGLEPEQSVHALGKNANTKPLCENFPLEGTTSIVLNGIIPVALFADQAFAMSFLESLRCRPAIEQGK